MSSVDGAQILDRGYRRYEGARSGVPGAVRSVVWSTTRSILGLGRKARHKIFPVIVMVVGFLPALSFMAIAVIIGDLLEGELRPEYWELFGFSTFAMLLFTALVAPEAVVRDRRDGMLSLYLSTPLTRPTYLAAKVLAVMGTLLIIILGPPMFALIGYTFQSQGPGDPIEWLEVVGKLIAGGLVIGVVYTAVSLGASSVTDRRAFASVAVIMVMFGALIIADVLVETAGVDPALRLIDPLSTPVEIAARLFGDRSEEYADVSTGAIAASCFSWTMVGSGAVWARYRRLAVV